MYALFEIVVDSNFWIDGRKTESLLLELKKSTQHLLDKSEKTEQPEESSHSPLNRTITTTRAENSSNLNFRRSTSGLESDGVALRIFLVRHGESLGNVNPEAYREYPDHKLPLTEKGHEMARETGVAIDKELVRLFGQPGEDSGTKLYLSPFTRTRQTAEGLLEGTLEEQGVRRWVTSVEESPLLVEQDWGLFEGSGIDDAPKKYPNEWKRAQVTNMVEPKLKTSKPKPLTLTLTLTIRQTLSRTLTLTLTLALALNRIARRTSKSIRENIGVVSP